MSMIFYLARIAPAQIASLRDDPVLALGVMHIASRLEYGDCLEHIISEPPPQITGPPEFVKQFEDQHRALQASLNKAAGLGLAPSLCLEKDWHILHFLFTGEGGSNGTASSALFAGEEVGEDTGYGPARILSPASTASFAEFLGTQNIAALKSRYDWRAMQSAHIYCAPYDANDAAVGLQGLEHLFPKLRDYVGDAASRGEGLLLWVS